MKQQIFEPFKLKFEQADWSRNPEFSLLDTLLDQHPELIKIAESDIVGMNKVSVFGRKDMPSVEQIVRAAIYKEMKCLDYRDLEYHQSDSRICTQFIKLDPLRLYSFQVFQKYISRISAQTLDRLLVELNKIAISEGLEDLRSFRQDSTVVETNIHYPTNNSLVWDCIKESTRLLEKLSEEIDGFSYRDYRTQAKKTLFKINNTKSLDKRVELFRKQLICFTKCINQVSNVIKKKDLYKFHGIAVGFLFENLRELLPKMRQVYSMTERLDIHGQKVPINEKIFSIYEPHTDIIAKRGCKAEFGHKVNFSTARSNLILSVEVQKGNSPDKDLFGKTLDKVIDSYGIVPRDSVTDGGYASRANQTYAREKGVVNVVFNKIVGSLKNIVSSTNMETRLKKWRSGIEAVISNYKRRYDMFRCNWKGEAHFRQKVLWSALAYNIRVMTSAVLLRL